MSARRARVPAPDLPQWFPSSLQALRPSEQVSPAEWADRHFHLPADSPRPGLWSTEWTEYLRAALEDFLDPDVHDVTLMTGAQVGKTSVLLILIGFVACERPRPMLYVMPREEDYEYIHSERIKPAIDRSPRIVEELTDRADDVGLSGIGFARCKLFYASARSPASLKSKPIAYVFLDEVEEMRDTSEGCPISMTGKRTTNYPDAKRYTVSTPGLVTGKTWQRWEQSDKRQYWVPCPGCTVYQVLEWEQVRYDPEGSAEQRAASAKLFCKECGTAISDADRREMIRHGLWVPEGGKIKPDGSVSGPETRHHGYHLPSLYSPFVTIEQLVYEALTEDWGDFVRQRLAWILENQVDAIGSDELERCKVDYELDTVPPDTVLLTGGVDVQGERLGFFYVVRAWRKDGSSRLVRARNVRSWGTIEDDVVLGEYGGRPVDWTFIDSGGTRSREAGRSRTDQVYDFCRSLARHCAPTKGRDQLRNGQFLNVTTPDTKKVSGKRATRGGLRLWNVNTLMVKDLLASLIGGERAAWEIPYHDGELSAYESHMRSEHKVERRGKEVWEIKHGKVRNDYWDAEALALAGWLKLTRGAIREPRHGKPQPSRPALGQGREIGPRRRRDGWGLGRRRRR